MFNDILYVENYGTLQDVGAIGEYKGYYLSYFGQCQLSFSMNINRNEENSNLKLIIDNQIEDELKPNTICWHENTNTWWVVKEDKSTRYIQDSGYYYRHEIELEDPINFLSNFSVHGLTFTSGRYTTTSMFAKIFKYSRFTRQYSITFDDNTMASQNNLFYSYDDYLLNAVIKEFANSIDCVPEITFTTKYVNLMVNSVSQGTYKNAYLINVLFKDKGGNTSSTPLDMDSHLLVEYQTINSNKSNYAERVISNCKNIVGNSNQLLPTGGAYITNDNYVLTGGTYSGAFDIGSKINEMKKLYYYMPIKISTSGFTPSFNKSFIYFKGINDASFELWLSSAYNTIKLNIATAGSTWTVSYDTFKSLALAYYNQYCYGEVENNGVTRLGGGLINYYVRLQNKLDWDLIEDATIKASCVYWEQGNKYLKNALSFVTYFTEYEGYERYSINGFSEAWLYFERHDVESEEIDSGNRGGYYRTELRVIANCITQSDVVLTYDNDLDGGKIKKYNQTAQLTNAFYFSKQLNNYAQSSSSSTIIRKYQCDTFDNAYKVGDLFTKNNVVYVINSASYDFYENDENNYFIDCTYSLSKNVVVRSANVNAESKIRDYDIPLKNNIKRTCTYKDYIEFGSSIENNSNFYNDIEKEIFNMDSSVRYGLNSNYLSLMKITWEEKVETYGLVANLPSQGSVNVIYFVTSTHLYYVWNKDTATYVSKGSSFTNPTTSYYKKPNNVVFLSKSIIIQNEFDDNNYIGTNLNATSTINPINPISFANYVNAYGEFTSIDFKIIDSVEFERIYNTSPEINRSVCSLSKEIYNNANQKVLINEPNYSKSGYEIPCFQYCVQVQNSNRFIIGENIMRNFNCVGTDENIAYIFVASNNLITNNNVNKPNSFFSTSTYFGTLQGSYYTLFNSVVSTITSNLIKLNFFLDRQYIKTIGAESELSFSGGYTTYPTDDLIGKSVSIYAVRFKITNDGINVVDNQFLFGMNNFTPNRDTTDSDNTWKIYISKWKILL